MKGKRKLPKILEIDEEQRLLNWTHQNCSFRDYVIILTILRIGLRANELRELLVSDISADGEIFTQLHVRAEIAHNHKPLSILLPEDLREQLLAFLEWKQQHGESVALMSFLFSSAKSPQITQRHLQRIVRESTKGALGKPYRVHDLRRTFESRIFKESNNDDSRTIPSHSPAPTDGIAENAETTFSSLSTPIHPIDGEYIKEWLILGPFFPDDLEADFLADMGGEANVQPKESDTFITADGRTLKWKRYKSEQDIVDLLDAVGNYENTTAYAFCILQSDTAGDAEIRLGSDDGVAVWINGKRVHLFPDYRSLSLDQDVFGADLKAGANRCLVKVFQEIHDWGFAVRMEMLPSDRAVILGTVADEKEKPIYNADVRLEQDGSEITQTKTDASGSYRLAIHPVSGTYDLSAINGVLGDWQLDVRLHEGESQAVNLKLRKAISIEGTLLMLDNSTPHVAVPVQAIRDGKATATVLSDESGKYQFVNLKPGNYQLTCQVLGGYVYYQKKGNGEARERGSGETLQVEFGKKLENVDFRFAHFKKGTWKNYTHSDGLSSMTVYAIHRDPDGVMWFGTVGGGVSRYDGKEFVNFTTKDGLADNVVWAIHRDPDGVMWFGTRGGVSRYDGKEFVNFTTKDGLVSGIAGIWSIHQDPDGTLWFGADGVSCYDGRKFVNFTEEDGLTGSPVHAIHRDPDGVMWFATFNGGLFRYDGKEFVNFTTKDGLPSNHVQVIYQGPDGMMWFGTRGGGVSRYDGKKFANLTTEDGLAHNWVWGVCRDPDGVMWFGTRGGLSRYDGVGFVNFTKEDGLPDDWVYSLYCDPNGVLWCGTLGNGVSRYDGKAFVNFTAKDGLVDDFVNAIHCGPEGVIWFGTSEGGVSRYDGKEFVSFAKEDGLAGNRVNAIQHNLGGVLWFGTEDGVSAYDGREFASFTTEDGLASNSVQAIYCAPDGMVWFATDRGISRYDGVEFVNFGMKNGLGNNDVTAIHGTSDGVIWVGSNDWDGHGVSRYDGKEFIKSSTEDGLPNTWIHAVYCSSDGLIWFGSWAGAFYYDGKEFVSFGAKDELAHGWVNAIYQSPDGIMWFGTKGSGVFCYDGVAWTSLDAQDGLLSNNVQAICQDKNGHLWFGTEQGVTRYHWNTVLPKVYIASVTADKTYRDLEAIPAFTTGTRITIEYNSIDFKTHPEKRQYRCRIREIDSDWRKPTKETSFDFIFEKAGMFTFEVQAIDRDLNYSEPATLSLTVQPDPVFAALQTEVEHLRREVGQKYHFEGIIGRSVGIRQVRALMERAIDSGLTVLVTGETGTGKELVAKAIHYNSPRKDHPLLDRNCAAIPKELLAGELFGHRKGAFTGAREDKMGLFEAAEGGTVLLDEISAMPQDAQVHLLRVLEERKIQRLGENISRDVNVRIIAMTNRDLMKEVAEGRFREDLYYRLSEFPIPIPPLRECVEDIPVLAEYFLQRYLQEIDKELDGFAPDVFEMLQSHPWPGNIRELRNVVRRAVALAEEGKQIQTYHFPSDITQGESLVQEIMSERVGYSESLNRFRRRLVEEALRECNGNRTQAAKLLRMSRPNLVTLIKRLSIDA